MRPNDRAIQCRANQCEALQPVLRDTPHLQIPHLTPPLIWQTSFGWSLDRLPKAVREKITASKITTMQWLLLPEPEGPSRDTVFVFGLRTSSITGDATHAVALFDAVVYDNESSATLPLSIDTLDACCSADPLEYCSGLSELRYMRRGPARSEASARKKRKRKRKQNK